jgi:transposase InsO family protein
VRRFALERGLAPQKPKAKAKPVHRWQTQKVAQLWQYDASPHRWFVGQNFQPTLLHMIDDHSRVILGARLYERETLLAHLEFASLIFQSYGLPLCLYVDYHSFFFTHSPEAHTQFAAALRFYDVSLRYAPTPQAKGKIERGHQFWQHRLPSLFAAEDINDIAQANPLLDQLRKHHNQMENHREIGSTPQQAWDSAKKEDRWALRPPPRCPWWSYVFTQRTRVTVGSDGKLAIGSQRLSVDVAAGTKVIRCHHPNGDVTVLKNAPQQNASPVVLLSTRLC